MGRGEVKMKQERPYAEIIGRWAPWASFNSPSYFWTGFTFPITHNYSTKSPLSGQTQSVDMLNSYHLLRERTLDTVLNSAESQFPTVHNGQDGDAMRKR